MHQQFDSRHVTVMRFLFGTMVLAVSLNSDGDFQEIEVIQGMRGGQMEYSDDNGRLLFAWFVPEG